jgi:hypothetical protein
MAITVNIDFSGSTQTWIFYAVEMVIFALRFLARIRQSKRWQLDDAFAVASVVSV